MKKVLLLITAAVLLVFSFPSLAAASPATPGKDIEKHVFVHYMAAGKPTKPGNTEGAYSLYKGGVKWASTPVSYQINATDAPIGASSEIVAAFEEWDNNTSVELFNNTVSTTTKSGVAYDHQNTISWTSISNSNIIAMTSFWVNTRSKQIVEFDIEFNTFYMWGTSGDSNLMDVRNIATHEIGHTLVLNDLYQAQNSAETMYGYSNEGEISKRTLEAGDIAGLRALYGN